MHDFVNADTGDRRGRPADLVLVSAVVRPETSGEKREQRMSSNLTDEELAALMPSELCQYQTPIPTQIVSSDEFYPDPQNERQREVEARLLAMADDLGGKQGLDRRRFFQTAAGMAASFVAMNQVYGELFDVTAAEAATPAMAQDRANALKDQFIMDMHTHFLRDDTRIMGFVEMRRRSARPAGTRSSTITNRPSRISNSTTTRRRCFSIPTPRSR